jgi:hypothetical protein
LGKDYLPERENWTCTYEVRNCKTKYNNGLISIIGDFYPTVGLVTVDNTNAKERMSLSKISQCEIDSQWIHCQFSFNKSSSTVVWSYEEKFHKLDQISCVYYKSDSNALELNKGLICASNYEVFVMKVDLMSEYLTNEQISSLTKPIPHPDNEISSEYSNCFPNCVIEDNIVYKRSWRSGHEIEIYPTNYVYLETKCLKIYSKSSIMTMTSYGIEFHHSSTVNNRVGVSPQNCLIKFVNKNTNKINVPVHKVQKYSDLTNNKFYMREISPDSEEHKLIEQEIVKDISWWKILWYGIIPKSVTIKTINGTSYTIMTDMIMCKNVRLLNKLCHDFMRNSVVLSKLINILTLLIMYLLYGGLIQIVRMYRFLKYLCGFKTDHYRLMIKTICFVFSKSKSTEVLSVIKNNENCCEISTSIIRVFGFSTKREIKRPYDQKELSENLNEILNTVHVFSNFNFQRRLVYYVLMMLPQYELTFWIFHLLWLPIGSIPYLIKGFKRGFEKNTTSVVRDYSDIIRNKHANEISKSHGMPKFNDVVNIIDDVGVIKFKVRSHRWEFCHKFMWFIFFLMINPSRSITYSIISDCDKNSCKREFVIDYNLAALEGNDVVVDLEDKITNKPVGIFKVEIINFTISNQGTYDYSIPQTTDVNTCYYFNDKDDCDTDCRKPWLMNAGPSADFSNDFWTNCKPKLNNFKSIGPYTWSTKTEYTELNEGFCAGWANLSPDFTKSVFRSFMMQKSKLQIYFKVSITTAELDFSETYFSDGSGLIEDKTNLFDLSMTLNNFEDNIMGKYVICKFEHGALTTLLENCIVSDSSFNSETSFIKFKGESMPPVMWRGPKLNSKITDTLSACPCSGEGEPWCDCDCTFEWDWSGMPIISDLNFKELGTPVENDQCVTEVGMKSLNTITTPVEFCIDDTIKSKQDCLNTVKGKYSDNMKWVSVSPLLPEGFFIKKTSCSHLIVEIKGNVKLPFNPKQKTRELTSEEFEFTAEGCWGRPNQVKLCITPKVPGTIYLKDGSISVPSFLIFKNTITKCVNATAAYESPSLQFSVLDATTGKSFPINKPINLKLCHMIEVGGNHAEGSLGSNYTQVSNNLDYIKIGILIASIAVGLMLLSCVLSIILKMKEVVSITGHKKLV